MCGFCFIGEEIMEKKIYSIDQSAWISRSDSDINQNIPALYQGVLKAVRPVAEKEISLGCIYIESDKLPKNTEWNGYCFSFPCDLRCCLANLAKEMGVFDRIDVLKEVDAVYNEAIEKLNVQLNNNPLLSDLKCTVAKNLSFGDVCVLCENDENGYDESEVIFQIAKTIKSLSQIYSDTDSVDTPDEKIFQTEKRILDRLYNTHIIKRNSHFPEYDALINELINAQVGSNDRKMYMLLLCALLLRAILDESSARWIYESGELKYESVESMTELSRGYELNVAGFDKFLKQVTVDSPNSDHVWSIFFITKSLLSSIVGRNKKEDGVINWRYRNFFGFVPYFDDAYKEVTSYFPTHISPDYCYGFLSIPNKNRFQLWSYFPAYIHEFFHYIPPMERRERNEKILHLAVYSVMAPLYVSLTAKKKEVYEGIVSKISFDIDNLRHNLIDVRNDFIGDIPVSRKDCEQLRDTMKYIAVMQDLIYLLDFESICDNATSELNFLEDSTWKEKCIARWNRFMASYIATFSFALREIRSDFSMCVLLDMNLKTYITLLANEPAFAESDEEWVADSTVLRFGFMTRLLYMKGQESWGNVDFHKLCDCMCSMTSGISDWKRECEKIIRSLAISPQFEENLCGYLEQYIEINGFFEGECKWDSVFEQALCSKKYSIQSYRDYENYPASKIESIDPQILICRWGEELKPIKKYQFVDMLSNLYKRYLAIEGDGEKHRFEYQSRLLFRDLLMYFPDIDLNV